MTISSPALAVLRRPRSLLVVAGALVVVLVWLMAFFLPQGRKLSSLQADERSLQEQVDAGNARVAALRVESQHSTEIQAMVQKLEGYAPATSDISYISQLSSAASASGVTVTSLTTGTPLPSAGSPYEAVPITAAVSGTYDDLLGFVQAIYDLQRLTDIDSIDLTGGGPTSSGSTVITATLDLEIFTSSSATTATSSTGS